MDNDGLKDGEEDADKDGNWEYLENETNPKEFDTDDDGLSDFVELNGWTVCITHEATREVLNRYNVTSNPLAIDSEGDHVSDFDEYQNSTDPWSFDSDKDGMWDIFEMKVLNDTSPTGFDGTPPNITRLDPKYRIVFGSLGGLIPTGINVMIRLSVTDAFGVNWVRVNVKGLADMKYYFNNETNVSRVFEFEVGEEHISNLLFKGFKINITAEDRNQNVGYKEDELPGLTEMVVSFLLGALLSFVKALLEFISGMFDWIYEAISSMLDMVIDGATKAMDLIITHIKTP